MHRIVRCLLLLCLVVLSVNIGCFAADTGSDVRKLIETFCSDEYRADLTDERDLIIKYTPEVYKKMRDEAGGYPYMVYIDSDPLFIVDQYKIMDVQQVDGKHVYATVYYHQLAKSKGAGDVMDDPMARKFIKDVRDITIKLNLEYDGKRWWIIDPPYPKVSYDVMVKYYSKEASDTYLYMTGKKGMPLRKSTAKEIARFTAVYNYEKTILDFLISLKK